MTNDPNANRRERRGYGSAAIWAAGAVILGLIAVYVLGDWDNRSIQNTAQHNQSTSETLVPKTVDENQPTGTQPQPDTGAATLPAQPVKPEQPAGGSTTQP